MHTEYEDIRSRITEEPRWFDEHAAPRYCDFHPSRCADVGCDEAVLFEIACQECKKLYRVALSSRGGRQLSDDIADKALHYGDPPNACDDGCISGRTMTSCTRRVLEYWHRRHAAPHVDPSDKTIADMQHLDWRRDRALEVDLGERE